MTSTVSLYTSDDCDDGVSVTNELVIGMSSVVSLYTAVDCDDGVSVTNELVIGMSSVVSLYTAVDCDDGVSAEYAVEHLMGATVSSVPQHISVQKAQSLLLSNVMLIILMSDGVSLSFNSTVHQLTFPVMISISQENA